MTTKLTLTIEKSVIEKAKRYAKGTQRSLSEMVQKYLESLSMEEHNKESVSVIDQLSGSLPLPEDFDEKEALKKYYSDKYGK